MTLKQFWKQSKFYLGVWFGGALLKLFFKLSRNERIDFHHYEKVRKENRSIILAVWHGPMLAGIYAMRNLGVYGMVGYHRDAEMIARMLSNWGYNLIRGSSRDGGKKALERSLELAKNPDNVLAITCDGPIGPARKLKPGTGVIAQKTGAVIIPLGCNGTRKKIIKSSWDTLYLYLPFSHNVVMYGEPIYPEEIQGKDRIKRTIELAEQRLNQVQERADHYFDGQNE